MKPTLSLVVFSLAVAVFPSLSFPQNDGRLAQAPAKAVDADLTGAWDGAKHADPNDDWGAVNLKATEAGYIGTYSDTFNGQLGSITFRRTGDGRYEGLWWESNLNRFGSLVLEVPKDARSISVAWKALSEGGARSGKSTWKRK
jgi:hypothetical protein